MFTEADRCLWYMRWLKKGFSHCYILRADGGNWLKYESGHGVMRVDILPNYEKPTKDRIMVKVKAVERKKWVLINSCVSMVKLITGVGSGITPYQLYKSIR